MIECTSCHTLNPDAEQTCLACGARLSRPAPTGAATLGTMGTTGTMGLTRCPAGHPIDPSWKSCPYCDRQRVVGGGAPAPSRATRLDPAPEQAAPGPQRTRLEEAAVPLSGRRTVLQEVSAAGLASSGAPAAAPSGEVPGPAMSPAPEGNAPVRRLLGVLAAPELGPGGAVFPVRAGRNTIGASRSNDIVLAGDSEVSGEHAVILHRNDTFHLTDRLSTNGTWVNGQEVPANGTLPLHDRDRIRCGRTGLVLLVIEPAEVARPG